MFLFPAIACLAALTCWWIHTFLGQQFVANALLQSNLHAFPKATLEACWHAVTVLLGLQIIALTFATWPGQTPTLRHYLLITVMLGTGPFALIFFLISRIRFGSIRVMPQSYLLISITLTTSAYWIWPIQIKAQAGFGFFLALALLLISLIHFVWAKGNSWPAKTREELTELVVGQKGRHSFPSTGITLMVALFFCLLALALVVSLVMPDFHGISRGLGWFLLVLFTLRGLGGFLEPRFRPWTRQLPYGHWNRVLYSPICLLLALTAFGILWSGP